MSYEPDQLNRKYVSRPTVQWSVDVITCQLDVTCVGITHLVWICELTFFHYSIVKEVSDLMKVSR